MSSLVFTNLSLSIQVSFFIASRLEKQTKIILISKKITIFISHDKNRIKIVQMKVKYLLTEKVELVIR